MTLVHIIAGLLAITAGFAALFSAKGGRLHRRSGIVFVGAMIVMAGLGGVIAAMQFHIGFQKMNVVAATLTLYLVVTALLTVRPNRGPGARAVDVACSLVALAAGLFAIGFGVDSLLRGPKLSWFPAAPAIVFGTIALLAALGDLRIARGRVLDPPHRIARHLWRMGVAMFIATASFFLGQAKVFPLEVRILPLLAAPVLLVLATMFFYWIRLLLTKRVPGAAVISAPVGKSTLASTPLAGWGSMQQ
jgi:uncharacterized membrane protein